MKIGALPGLGGILHCFTGTLAEAQQGLDLGFMISFTGNVTYPKAQEIREVTRADSAGPRVLIETDSPYLAPLTVSRQAQRACLRKRSS